MIISFELFPLLRRLYSFFFCSHSGLWVSCLQRNSIFFYYFYSFSVSRFVCHSIDPIDILMHTVYTQNKRASHRTVLCFVCNWDWDGRRKSCEPPPHGGIRDRTERSFQEKISATARGMVSLVIKRLFIGLRGKCDVNTTFMLPCRSAVCGEWKVKNLVERFIAKIDGTFFVELSREI